MDIYDIIEYYQLNNNLDSSDLTLKEHIDKLYQLTLEEYKDINNITELNEEDYVLLYDEFSQTHINYLDDYLNDVNVIFTRIDAIKVPEQRTKEWYIERSKLISASDASYAIVKTNSFSNYNRTLLQKIGVKFDYFSTPAMLHGTIFEIVSQNIYETRKNITIKEYGCLPHHTINFIGASPDGIVSDIKDKDNLDQVSLIGRMIEIKNPYSRVINDIIKFEYSIQIQVQLQVTGLDICDFIETKITSPYEDINEFLDDIYDITCDISENPINNINIPIKNLACDGQEKGVLLHFFKPHDDRDENVSEIFPLTSLYTKTDILKWQDTIITKYTKNNYKFIKCYYWKLDIYDIKTVKRDDNEWNNTILPALTDFWTDVKQTRQKTNEDIINRFNNIEFDETIEEVKNGDEIIKRQLKYIARAKKKQKIVYKFSDET